jgi:hypothetical protein
VSTGRGTNSEVHHPHRYNNHPSGVECIDIKRLMSSDAGDAFKYVFREEYKNGKQDLEKALFYLKDLRRHEITIWVQGYVTEGRDLLQRVIEAEPNPMKANFYKALRNGKTMSALIAVNYLLRDAG